MHYFVVPKSFMFGLKKYSTVESCECLSVIILILISSYTYFKSRNYCTQLQNLIHIIFIYIIPILRLSVFMSHIDAHIIL